MKCLLPTIIGLCILNSCGTEPTSVHTLNTSVNGEGQIGYSVGDMEKITISSGQEQFDKGESITLTALPDSGWFFINWGGQVTSQTNPTSIIMDGNKSIYSNYNRIGAFCNENYNPPFSGTIYVDSDIITEEDHSTFISLSYTGRADRLMYDRRYGWVTLKPFLFPAKFDDSLSIEIQVNPEFETVENAQNYALKYAKAIGRLTTQLRKDVKTTWIHRGNEPFGGGNNNLLIHTDWSETYYEGQGILEETLVHEAAHTSLDSYHANSSGWLAAQTKDCEFISTYAQDNPYREDIAESYLLYLAIRFRPERISEELKRTIEKAIPNRIEYFDEQNFDMYPIR